MADVLTIKVKTEQNPDGTHAWVFTTTHGGIRSGAFHTSNGWGAGVGVADAEAMSHADIERRARTIYNFAGEVRFEAEVAAPGDV